MIYMYISFVREELEVRRPSFGIDSCPGVWFKADEAVNSESLTMPECLAGGLLRGDKMHDRRMWWWLG